MRRIILLLAVMVVLWFLVVGTARAEGAWVLWLQASSSSKGSTWEIVGAYPSYNSCIEAEKLACNTLGSYECMPCDGGHYANIPDHSTNKTKSSLLIWKCFPESIDPRK